MDGSTGVSPVRPLAPTGSSTELPAHVVTGGYVRVPVPVLAEINKLARTYRKPHVRIRMEPGRFRFESFTRSHSDIVMRPTGVRVADPPVDAPPADALAIQKLYSAEEIAESGLAARVVDAQAFAAKHIDGALVYLAPFGITRDEIVRLIDERITTRARLIKSRPRDHE